MRLLNNKPVQTFLAVGPAILSALCFIGYFAFFVLVLGNMYKMENSNPPSGVWLNGVGVFVLLASILFVLSTVYFVLHAAQNPLLEKGNMRVVWILIIILLSGIGNFIYWLLEIRNKKPGPVIGDLLSHEKQNDWSRGLYMKS